jgi:NAD(P)H-dependent flavin oxidoreductase YrpB (nitropropane dioxygenase family)
MSPQLRTPLCDLLGIDVPIMQAGMGNVAYGRMAAAVSNAGGLGSISGIDIPPEEVDAEIKLFRSLSSRPLCVDLGFPAGGLAKGAQIAACLTMGAQGAWVGTRFLASRESGSEDVFKEAVVEAGYDTTLRSQLFDGLHVRMLRNRFTEVWDGHEDELSSFPVQRVLTMPFKYAAARATLKSHMSLPAGAGSGMINDLPGAAEVLGRLVAETVEALRTVATAVKFG